MRYQYTWSHQTAQPATLKITERKLTLSGYAASSSLDALLLPQRNAILISYFVGAVGCAYDARPSKKRRISGTARSGRS